MANACKRNAPPWPGGGSRHTDNPACLASRIAMRRWRHAEQAEKRIQALFRAERRIEQNAGDEVFYFGDPDIEPECGGAPRGWPHSLTVAIFFLFLRGAARAAAPRLWTAFFEH